MIIDCKSQWENGFKFLGGYILLGWGGQKHGGGYSSTGTVGSRGISYIMRDWVPVQPSGILCNLDF